MNKSSQALWLILTLILIDFDSWKLFHFAYRLPFGFLNHVFDTDAKIHFPFIIYFPHFFYISTFHEISHSAMFIDYVEIHFFHIFDTVMSAKSLWLLLYIAFFSSQTILGIIIIIWAWASKKGSNENIISCSHFQWNN